MHDQYPVDHHKPADARTAFEYLKQKDIEEQDGIVFQGSDFFDPLRPIRSGNTTHYAFLTHYEPHENGLASSRIMMADLEEGRPVGFGQIFALRNREGETIQRPYVVYTETEPAERNRGLGRARLIALNTYAIEQLGQTLSSSDNILPEATSVWRGLVRDGLAEEWNGRFRFREVAEG